MATLQELLAQKEALEQQIEQTKKQERGDAINKVRALMAEYGLTVADLGGKAAPQGQVRRRHRQGGGEVSQCLDRRILERPRPAAALAEGGAGERQASSPTSQSDPSRRRAAAPRRRSPTAERCAGSLSNLRVIPPAFVHDLLSRVDIVEIVGRSVELKQAGTNQQGPVPLPRREVAELHRQPVARRPTTASAAACTATPSAS